VTCWRADRKAVINSGRIDLILWQENVSMATVNGLGTMRYDWSSRSDGTAEATLWFVIFFLPIVPLRREHIRVVSAEVERPDVLSTMAALGGAGSGWKTRIEVLDRIPQSPWRTIGTYVKGFIGVPLVTFVGPMLLLTLGVTLPLKRGAPTPEWVSSVTGVCSIAILIWTAVFIARILDRSAGRLHVARNVNAPDRKRRRSGSTEGTRRRKSSSIQNEDE
jgi:hypothetical protein